MVEIGCFISILLIIGGFLLKNNKPWMLIQILWIWILLAFNDGGMDYDGNKAIFDNIDFIIQIDFGLSEWLNSYLASWLLNSGWNFEEYNILLSTTSLMVIFYFAYKKCNNINVFLSLFMLYPLVFLVIQKRYFWSIGFCLLSFLFLERRKKIKSVLTLFLATGFHISAVFFLPYMILVNKKCSYLYILFAIIELGIILFYRDYIILLMGSDSSKALEYTTSEISFFGAAFFVCFQLILIWLISKMTNNQKVCLPNEQRNIFFLYNLNIVSLLYMPLLLLNSIFFRYYRAIILFGYCFIADNINSKYEKSIYMYIVSIIIFISVLLSFGKFGWEDHLNTLFKYNTLLRIID